MPTDHHDSHAQHTTHHPHPVSGHGEHIDELLAKPSLLDRLAHHEKTAKHADHHHEVIDHMVEIHMQRSKTPQADDHKHYHHVMAKMRQLRGEKKT